MKLIVCALMLATAALSAANVEEWLQSGLLHPDLITSLREELALTSDQQAKLGSQLDEARIQAEPLEQAVKEQQKALNHLLRDSTSTADAAGAQLTKLLEAEAAIKQLQLRTLLGIRDMLTPEQLEKVKKIGPPKMAAQGKGNNPESGLTQKTEKLKAGLESLGIPPTDAMKTRGGEIKQLIKSGQFAAADTALDQLIEDSGLKELEAEADKVDFSKYEPGSTDIETLKQRYEDVKTAGQEILSLPLMRDLLQAKDAFEIAKEAQDTDKIGRILTYVEGRLKK